MKYIDTWDLETIFPGGTKSEELQAKLTDVQNQITEYQALLNDWDYSSQSVDTFKTILNKQEAIGKGLGQSGTFVNMWHDAYMNDEHANVVKGQIMELYSEVQKLSNTFTKKLVEIPNTDWTTMLEDSDLKELSFALNEIRSEGKRLLSEEEEKLIAELNKDGLAAWSNLYDTVVSIITIPFTDKEGNTTELSVGQAMNRMYADPDPEVRSQLFENWEAAWTKYGPIFADTLNHLDGYRITLQKKHQYKDHLEEPLEYNRMTEDTLNAMWSAVSNNKKPFLDFLDQKAKLLGMEKLGWQDVDAPVALGEVKPTQFTYDEACDFVIENFSSFGPKLADFAKHALENRWVEAEDRPNKRPGGYCTSLPEFGESRIFMTFTGSSSDTSTLAHELGHAFHSHVMKDLPTLNRRYAMNVAETASTFAETIIGNATVANAKTKEEKASLLNAKLENATAMFMNIHARFLFEDAFYKERAKGIVSEKRLNELMVEAQKEAYGDSLASYHPHFWCSKLHFFIDGIPFYNFPYTFGFLFSLGIYAEYLKDKDGFEDKYIALLRDTGSMKVEDLAQKHLGVDITKEDFWTAGIQLMAKDAAEFIELTNEIVK
ncbi:M3 family oligoendopeptidase [Ornithinibacillus sp. BX22]|uniref:M3 family oligoendopeptidase n=2 Tax=Ornithinibacillus TaxID=484508 RepID=A0A923L4F2_9BACI|nr:MULTISPECIES: M3 family oligoendopeptidase [Ornithinibacillus]MBC5636211.1 M3 family oligoendopeptidase [Ornithinibacillus hominis]MBS3681051.1 M3 family oligoendopeptidase [Ornithinibacillus massiliensis]